MARVHLQFLSLLRQRSCLSLPVVLIAVVPAPLTADTLPSVSQSPSQFAEALYPIPAPTIAGEVHIPRSEDNRDWPAPQKLIHVL